MEKRVAVIGIVVEKEESAETVNAILHEIPRRDRRKNGNPLQGTWAVCDQRDC